MYVVSMSAKIKKISSKVKSLAAIARIAKIAKAHGKTVVTTNGAFDILHVGHVRNLGFAKSQGDILIVGVNSDASVKACKGPKRPIVGENERAEILASLNSVDYVFIFNDVNPIPWLKKIKPNVHVKGADRSLGQIVEKDTLKKIGAKFAFAPLIKGKSSTNVIEKITKVYKG